MTVYNKHQSGVTLVIGLVVLLLLTIIVMTAMRVTALQERMARNAQNHNIAFQSAESALREAEARIDGGAVEFNPLKLSNGPFQTAVCLGGLCGATLPLQSDNIANADATETQTAATGITNIHAEPKYMIELMRIDPSTDSGRVYAIFRITTRAQGGDSTSFVNLQSTYRVHVPSFIL